jgi:hypothetical protein
MARGGQIIDASIVPVPTQRNSRDENADPTRTCAQSVEIFCLGYREHAGTAAPFTCYASVGCPRLRGSPAAE